MEVVRDGCGRAAEGGWWGGWSELVAGSADGGAAGGSCAVLAVDRGRRGEHGCRGCCGCVSLVPLSGRYLSFAEREEIAILHAQRVGGA